MRTDMAQLLVESPRHNTGESFKTHRRKANQDPESAPTKQGMRRPYMDRKSFGEYFPPLMGFLRKNVGRPWDKVFSELTAVLHGGGTVIEHTKMHLLRDFVILKPHWIDGKPHQNPPWYSSQQLGATPLNGDYYVDLYGILRYAREIPRPRRSKGPESGLVPIDDRTAYLKIDGLWYRVWFKMLPVVTRGMEVYDIVLKKWIRAKAQTPYRSKRDVAEYLERYVHYWALDGDHGTWGLERFYGKVQYAYRKEAISSRTIRREGLDKKKAA